MNHDNENGNTQLYYNNIGLSRNNLVTIAIATMTSNDRSEDHSVVTDGCHTGSNGVPPKPAETDSAAMDFKPRSHYPASSQSFRWVIVFCSFCIFSLASVTQITFGIFITELEEIFGLSRTMIGVIGAFRMSLSSMGGELNIIHITITDPL